MGTSFYLSERFTRTNFGTTQFVVRSTSVGVLLISPIVLVSQKPTKLQLVLGERVATGTKRVVSGDDAMEIDQQKSKKGQKKGASGGVVGGVYTVEDVTNMGVLVQQLLQASN
jgi:hypothetical protein